MAKHLVFIRPARIKAAPPSRAPEPPRSADAPRTFGESQRDKVLRYVVRARLDPQR